MDSDVRDNDVLYSVVQDKLLPFTEWVSTNTFYHLYLVTGFHCNNTQHHHQLLETTCFLL
jgi:hypothetical protein